MYRPRWRRRTWSSQGQDLFVCEVLSGLRGGYFLDSGAGDGTDGSNTRLLEEEYGWSGICVEPNADMYAPLRRDRSCTCLHCCLYSRDDNVPFLEGARELGGILEAFRPLDLARAKEAAALLRRGDRPVVVDRQARRPLTILEETGAPRVIDYWSLDTEGSELEILRCFPFGRYRVRVITVEHNHGPAREPIRELLEAQGYQRVVTLGIDDGYVLRRCVDAAEEPRDLRGGLRRRASGRQLPTVLTRPPNGLHQRAAPPASTTAPGTTLHPDRTKSRLSRPAPASPQFPARLAVSQVDGRSQSALAARPGTRRRCRQRCGRGCCGRGCRGRDSGESCAGPCERRSPTRRARWRRRQGQVDRRVPQRVRGQLLPGLDARRLREAAPTGAPAAAARQ